MTNCGSMENTVVTSKRFILLYEKGGDVKDSKRLEIDIVLN